MYVDKLEYEKMKQVYEATKITFNLVNVVSSTSVIVAHENNFIGIKFSGR